MSQFVYIIVGCPADSMAAFSSHVSEQGPTSTFAVYATMDAAAKKLAEIYEQGIYGVRFGHEYAIIKHRVSEASE